MKRIKFTLNGEVVEVETGTTILSAAESRGIFIPTFCHTNLLKPLASCFVCVVEVEGEPDLIPSCSTTVHEGMVVKTSTDRVKKARRTCIELLLSDHLGDCLGPCMSSCPAGIDIPGFIKYLALGEDREALKLIKHNLPFPGVLGRICERPCEDACRRLLVEEPVAICHLKRFAADAVSNSGDEYVPEIAPATSKKVAIIGAGPTGLTAAYYLQILGHECTIFDANEMPGGMLRYGIPIYRLPRNVLDTEVAVIVKLGAKILCNRRLGQDVFLDKLRNDFDAVFLSLGAQKALSLNLDGEDAEGVMSGIDFLRREEMDPKSSVGQKVIIIGGGGVAIDSARIALRKGATDVRIYCLEKPEEMPAIQDEIDASIAEGITIHHQYGVKKVLVENGKVVGVELKRCIGVFDKNGNFSPLYDESDISKDNCETLIIAIGQLPDLSGLDGSRSIDTQIASGSKQAHQGLLKAHEHTLQTNLKDVFAGGDWITGPDIAVNAVAAGRKAAISIDQFIMGEEVVGDPQSYNHSMGELEAVPKKVVEKFEREPRTAISELDPKIRVRNFDEVETGFTPEMARAEAKRCIECGCRDAKACSLRRYATLFEADENRFMGDQREYDLDESHPEILYESHKCIQCCTCVRITEELLGTSSMQVVGRGFTSRVKPRSGRELALVNGEGLSQIVENCPVGALTFKKAPVQTLEPVFNRPMVS